MKNLNDLPEGTVVYIAGKMSGIKCYNFKRFFYWQVMLESLGLEVINPAEMDCERFFAGVCFDDMDYREVLDLDRKHIREEADAIFFLDGWEESPGALEEREEATEKGIPFFYELARVFEDEIPQTD